VTFEQFVKDHLHSLLRMATAMSMKPALAEDLVQEVLIKVMKRWDHVKTRDDTEMYVRRMLVNEYISWRRKWARIVPRAEVLIDDDCPDPAAAHAERAELVSRLATLPRRQRVVLALRYFEDIDDAAIASILGCRPGTVRGYASRALATLRDEAADEKHALDRGPLS
jgi:RNA polymerase sigma-70 factor (sigma-E family)